MALIEAVSSLMPSEYYVFSAEGCDLEHTYLLITVNEAKIHQCICDYRCIFFCAVTVKVVCLLLCLLSCCVTVCSVAAATVTLCQSDRVNK